MKIICGVLMLLGSFSVHAAGNSEEIYASQKFASQKFASQKLDQTQKIQTQNIQENTIRFSGGVVEGTCVNSMGTTHCNGAYPPIRTEKEYSFGSIVTLTYL